MAKARQRCWRAAWVLDLDIKSFFDSIDHELLLCAVRKHTRENWVVLYIKRWLTAPVERSDGRIQAQDRGTPQGGVISPLLANLYLHYAFDLWMVRNFPTVLFARYADDVICPCRSALPEGSSGTSHGPLSVALTPAEDKDCLLCEQ